MLFRAFSQLLAGILCIYSLKFGYGLSLLYAFVALFIVLQFKEVSGINKTDESFCKQLLNCAQYWKNPLLLLSLIHI